MSVAVPVCARRAASAVPAFLRAAPILATLLFVLCSCGGTSGQPTGPQVASQAAETTSGSAGSILVQTAFIPTPPGRTYPPGSVILLQLVISNKSSSWDELTSITTPVASHVTLNQFGTGQPFISLTSDPMQSDVVAQLEDATRTVAPGERVPVTFHFSSAGSLTLQVPVRTREVPSKST